MSTKKQAHHFTSLAHEFEACKLGIWLFLLTEILMFGGLFVVYIIFHEVHPEMFKKGASFLDWKLGALNTVVLLFSSLSMALGVFYAQKSKPKKSFYALLVTLLCGFIFMIVKYIEYSSKISHGLLPGEFFSDQLNIGSNLGLYFSLYFCMTGLHGIHVLLGMALIAWVAYRTKKNEFNSSYYTPVEGVGLFWHLVDLVWIYLFPLLYLVG